MKRVHVRTGTRVVRELLMAVATLMGVERASGQFEGVVTSRNVTTNETGAPQEFMMTMSVKSDRIRIETTPVGEIPGTVMVYRADRHLVWMLNDDERTYLEMLQGDATQNGRAPLHADPGVKPTIRKTGKTRTLLGFAAEQILVHSYEQDTELWGTRALKDLSETIARVVAEESAGGQWVDEVKGMGYFPLVASTRIDGKVVESQEITRIENRPLPDSLFELPSGYRKQEIGEGLGAVPRR